MNTAIEIISAIFIVFILFIFLYVASQFIIHDIMIILTRLGFIKWKKNLNVQNIIFEPMEKYKTIIGKKEYKILKTTTVIPQSCCLDIYKNGIHMKRYDNCYKLYEFLEKRKTEPYIPQDIINQPKIWRTDKIEFIKDYIRKQKFKQILK